MSFPVVLGSVKSGAFSPTSTAVATPPTPSTLTSSAPDRNRLFIRFANIFPLLSFHRTIFSYPITQVPRCFASVPQNRSADDPISPIQHLRRDREPQGFRDFQIDD